MSLIRYTALTNKDMIDCQKTKHTRQYDVTLRNVPINNDSKDINVNIVLYLQCIVLLLCDLVPL